MRKRQLFIFLLIYISLLLCSVVFAEENNRSHTLRIALCHLDVSQGPQDKNIKKIEKAIHIAGNHGANWILTPETALQGYYFYVIDPTQKEKIKTQPSESVRPLQKAVSQYGAYLFLGAGEREKRLTAIATPAWYSARTEIWSGVTANCLPMWDSGRNPGLLTTASWNLLSAAML